MSSFFTDPDFVCSRHQCVNNIHSCSSEFCDSCEKKRNQLNIIREIRPFVKEYLIPQINNDIIIEQANILHYENNLSYKACDIETIHKCIAQKQQLFKHIRWCIHSKMIDLVDSSDLLVPHLQSIQTKLLWCKHYRDVHSFHWHQSYKTKDVDKIQMHADNVRLQEQYLHVAIKEIERMVCTFCS